MLNGETTEQAQQESHLGWACQSKCIHFLFLLMGHLKSKWPFNFLFNWIKSDVYNSQHAQLNFNLFNYLLLLFFFLPLVGSIAVVGKNRFHCTQLKSKVNKNCSMKKNFFGAGVLRIISIHEMDQKDWGTRTQSWHKSFQDSIFGNCFIFFVPPDAYFFITVLNRWQALVKIKHALAPDLLHLFFHLPHHGEGEEAGQQDGKRVKWSSARRTIRVPVH